MKLVVILFFLFLGGCATHSEQGRQRALAPQEVGAVYSGVEMQARLAMTPEVLCEEDDCISAQAFRTRVLDLGERVGDAAYSLAFERDLPVPGFLITVPPKDDIGTLSNASGEIVLFGGIRDLRLTDAALAFVLAREMGHILARHHEENTAMSIGVSVAVTLLFPVAGVLRSAEVAYAAAATTSLASSAVSFAGTRILRSIYRAEQVKEADAYALEIIALAGFTPYEVAAGLHAAAPMFLGDGWMEELRDSVARLDLIAVGPPYLPIVEDAAEPTPLLILPPLAAEEIAERRLVFVDLTALDLPQEGMKAAATVCKPTQKKADRSCIKVVPQVSKTTKKPVVKKAPVKLPPKKTPPKWG